MGGHDQYGYNQYGYDQYGYDQNGVAAPTRGSYGQGRGQSGWRGGMRHGSGRGGGLFDNSDGQVKFKLLKKVCLHSLTLNSATLILISNGRMCCILWS